MDSFKGFRKISILVGIPCKTHWLVLFLNHIQVDSKKVIANNAIKLS